MSFPDPSDYMTYKNANSGNSGGGNGSGCLWIIMGILFLLLIAKACS